LIGFLAVVSAGNFAGHPETTGGKLCTVDMCRRSLARARTMQPRKFRGAILAKNFFLEHANGPNWEFCPIECRIGSHDEKPSHHENPRRTSISCSSLMGNNNNKNILSNHFGPICPRANNHE
jgi:hypothetical protein